MKNYINEIFMLRAIACLSIVLLHSINYAIFEYRTDLSTLEYLFSSALGMILYFGTPTFILISEILISNSYRDYIPKNFLTKRVKYILIPYVIMALVYALIDITLEGKVLTIYTFISESFKNIFLGDWHGYFVLIIFQFYILHKLLYKKLKIWKPSVVLAISFGINVLYLSFFKLTEPMNFLFSEYIWLRFHWIPVFGWIFYFFLAYYIGLNYTSYLKILKKNKILITLIFSLSFLIIMVLTYLEIFERSSKRPDMIIYTCSLVFLLFILASYLKRIPKIFSLISRYSYGIYLLHMIFLRVIFQPHPDLPFWLYAIYIFVGSMVGSMIVIFLVNKLPFGKYIVGKVGVKPKS